MGLLNFVKSAGAKLLGLDDEEAIKAEAQAQAKAQNADMEALRRQIHRQRVSALLEKHVLGLGLDIREPQIGYDGERVTLAGQVPNQETAEKILLAVGNHEGVAAVDNQLRVLNPEPEAVFYTVVRGDTLSKIAKQHYDNAKKYNAIFEANRPMLEHPDRIYPGQVLRIPPQS